VEFGWNPPGTAVKSDDPRAVVAGATNNSTRPPLLGTVITVVSDVLVHCLRSVVELLLKTIVPCANPETASAEMANIPSSFFIGLFCYVVGVYLNAF
jgi:hypothetical protein